MNVSRKHIPTILLTVDVEDWFQVENLKGSITYDTWESREIRVCNNTRLLLDMFDSIQINSDCGPVKPKATFFILGWVAERFPELVKEIYNRGHEVASHGYMHHLCNRLSPEELKNDLLESKKLIESIVGSPVVGYRAPSFSINRETLWEIQNCGFSYDSSYNSFEGHGRYGHVDFTNSIKLGSIYKLSESFCEIPISNMSLGGRIIPWGGGGYFRLMPSWLFHMGVRQILKKEGVFLFYTHPWEFDPLQPRVDNIPMSYKFRHYANLRKTKEKLIAFINAFSHCEFVSCKTFLEKNIPEFQVTVIQ